MVYNMSYYLRKGNEVLNYIDEVFSGIEIAVSAVIGSETRHIQVLSFTTRVDAEDFKKEHPHALRNFTVSNNLDYE